MSRIEPVAVKDLDPEMQAIMAAGNEIMGFTSNDSLIMAHKPALLKAMLSLVQAVYQPGAISLDLKKMIAMLTSSAAGCQYCKVHTSYGAIKEGVAADKLAAIWEYATSPLFSDAERAALDVARTAALTPNETTDENFAQLRAHYSDEQIVEIIGVISLFGFLNRWNSTIATELEDRPKTAVTESGLI